MKKNEYIQEVNELKESYDRLNDKRIMQYEYAIWLNKQADKLCNIENYNNLSPEERKQLMVKMKTLMNRVEYEIKILEKDDVPLQQLKQRIVALGNRRKVEGLEE